MAASIESEHRLGRERDAGCRPYEQALAEGAKYPFIMYNSEEAREVDAQGKTLSDVNMRVSKVQVSYDVTGCVIDLAQPRDMKTETRIKRGECPEKLRERCGSCIMTLMEESQEAELSDIPTEIIQN